MKLIVISPSKTSESETKHVTGFFEHGLETFHLRKPSMSTKDMRKYIESIPAHFHDRIVIHSHHKLAGEFSLKGIHLTRQHVRKRITTWMRMNYLKMRKPSLTVSMSFHKLSSIYENKKEFNYVLLGTIFDSVSEKFNAGYNEHSLRAALAKSEVPVIARGGTMIRNIQVCHDLGFAGMIFYSAVWKKEDPVTAFTEILAKYRELNIPVE